MVVGVRRRRECQFWALRSPVTDINCFFSLSLYKEGIRIIHNFAEESKLQKANGQRTFGMKVVVLVNEIKETQTN